MLNCFSKESSSSIPITVILLEEFPNWLQQQDTNTQAWLTLIGFKPELGATCYLAERKVIVCVSDISNPYEIGHLPLLLTEGVYHFENLDDCTAYAIGWGLGAYQFTRYKSPTKQAATLVLKENVAYVTNMVESIYLTRDLINTPTDDMGPSELAIEVEKLAKEFNASFAQIVGEDLITQNFASIYTVGRASDDAPRLLEMRWGNSQHPKIALVGKGVCFDSGGLDIKDSPHMLLMKKDMGGSANVLGLARMIMCANLPVCLRVLIPAVENVISGNAYRPGDIIKSRKGLTIEINNTDAEGRLVLADALAEAASDNPELIIDLATLTGAARVALGTDVPAIFSNDDDVVTEIIKQGIALKDYLWRLPLFTPYKEALKSPIADLNNSPLDGYGGAISAALFLQEFISADIPWLHVDMMAWNLRTRPGRPQGGEAMGIRAMFNYLNGKYV